MRTLIPFSFRAFTPALSLAGFNPTSGSDSPPLGTRWYFYSARVPLLAAGFLITTARALIIMILLPVLSGCIPAAIGVATVATVTVIDLSKERRTVGTVVDDNLIEVSIMKDVVAHRDLGTRVHVSPTVVQGVVLLTGEVGTDHQKSLAGQIANSYQGVSQVVNQLDLVGNSSLTSRANDSLITAKVKTALLREKTVDSTNIKVVTERGTVYLMGIVGPVEGETAVQITQKIGGVNRIIKIFMSPE